MIEECPRLREAGLGWIKRDLRDGNIGLVEYVGNAAGDPSVVQRGMLANTLHVDAPGLPLCVVRGFQTASSRANLTLIQPFLGDLGVERLKAMGLISEIVSWKLRLYVPTGAVGAEVLGRLLERFPLQRVSARKAA